MRLGRLAPRLWLREMDLRQFYHFFGVSAFRLIYQQHKVVFTHDRVDDGAAIEGIDACLEDVTGCERFSCRDVQHYRMRSAQTQPIVSDCYVDVMDGQGGGEARAARG